MLGHGLYVCYNISLTGDPAQHSFFSLTREESHHSIIMFLCSLPNWLAHNELSLILSLYHVVCGQPHRKNWRCGGTEQDSGA